MIPCPTVDCETTAPDVGTLIAHLVNDDRLKAWPALCRAREAVGLATERPLPLPPPAPREPRPPAKTHHADPAARYFCARVAPEKCKRHGGPGWKPTPHIADPAPCRYCARFAPEKCHRHGGPSRSTSFGGKGGPRGSLATIKAAATRTRCSLVEYEQHVTAGDKWCWRCRAWHLSSAFGVDRARHDGLMAECRQSKNDYKRALYAARKAHA